ncbi:hypothetical protein ACSBR2_030663 [Camellia fascicularis]
MYRISKTLLLDYECNNDQTEYDKLFEKLSNMIADQFASIDEWRTKMRQANPSTSFSSSHNDFTPSGSNELAIDVESKA